MAQNDDKAELIAELARARVRLADTAVALRRDLDFPTRARKAFKSSPLPWLAAAGVLGLVVARFAGKKSATKPARKIKDPVVETAGKAGLVLGALKIAFDLARPTLLKWATQRFSDYMAKGQRSDFHHS